ncbi:MAG TPA: hypothetical protein VKT28_10575 [Puia sp.]|nr:hypothetical protein [Puia sp.]
MVFFIAPKINGIATRLKVELISQQNGLEKYKVTAKNRELIFQTNQLMLKQKGLKHKRAQWKIISGNLNNTYAFEKIVEAIAERIED